MATFVADVSASEFAALATNLTNRPLYVNPYRVNSGTGRTQAFGLVRRWSYRPWISRNCWLRPELWQLLMDFAAKHVPIPWDAVQVNDCYESKPHRDNGNRGLSYIVSFGDYTGGELVLDVSGQEATVDTRHRGHLFNGAITRHWNRPIVGRKFSLVFFSIEWPRFWPESNGRPICTIVQRNNKPWVHIEDCDGSVWEARGPKMIMQQAPTRRVSRVGRVEGFGGRATVADVPETSDPADHSS